uniref:At1g61320/AtMIF1 LRR domain-containing protein n=1 Tax=Triticum aestivum TaxID=4565 RepID=A0A3B6PFS1_WHEAT
MREAARTACISPTFFHSWRCHSNLIFTKDTIGLKRSACGEYFGDKIDRILRNHSGCLKTFNIDYYGTHGFTGTSYFDRWLQIALKAGIEELTLVLSEAKQKYNFPCSLLSDGVRNSLRYLRLQFCALHPTVELGPLRSLKSLYLWRVSITWNELECLIFNSLTLELLDLISCPQIECLKLPCALQRLSALSVLACERLKVIESKAPNLSSLYLCGNWLDFSLVETLPIKELELQQTNLIWDARAKLPSLMPNIETLAIQSSREVYILHNVGCCRTAVYMVKLGSYLVYLIHDIVLVQVVDAPMLPTKFLHLKHLTITVRSGAIVFRACDYFSLVSFLDASPSLETLILDVTQRRMVHESIFADSQLRHMPEHRHGHLKNVKISGFNSAKCVVELTCYILKNAVSLECLTLDTIYGSRCDDQGEDNRCTPMTDGILMEIPGTLGYQNTH